MKTTRDKRAFQPSLEHYKKAVTDELECTICSHWYDDHQRKPKLIPGCGHTICLVCIKDIMRSNGGVRFRCPFDQKVYDIDNGDPETLTNNITLMGMLDLSEGSLAKKSMHKSINLLKERIETLQGKETKFNEYRSIFLASIHNHFDQAMEYVEEERKRLTDEFDEACEMTREGTPALSLLDEMKKCLQSAEQLLEQDTETLVDQAPDMLEKIYTYNMEDIEDIQNQDVELKFNFLPEKFTGSLGEIEVTKLLVVNQDVSVSRVKSLQKIVWLFISTMLISLHVRFEPYINSRYAIAVRYYTFKYPIISKLRSVFASYLDDPSYTVCSFVEDLTFLYVTLGFWGACASLGHYYCLFLKFEEMRNEVGDTDKVPSTIWGWLPYICHLCIVKVFSMQYTWQYVVMFQILLTVYLFFTFTLLFVKCSKNQPNGKVKQLYGNLLVKSTSAVSAVYHLAGLTSMLSFSTVLSMILLAFVSIPNLTDCKVVLFGEPRIIIISVIAALSTAISVFSTPMSAGFLWNVITLLCTIVILSWLVSSVHCNAIQIFKEVKDNYPYILKQAGYAVVVFLCLIVCMHAMALWRLSTELFLSHLNVFIALCMCTLCINIGGKKYKISPSMLFEVSIIPALIFYTYDKTFAFIVEMLILLFLIIIGIAGCAEKVNCSFEQLITFWILCFVFISFGNSIVKCFILVTMFSLYIKDNGITILKGTLPVKLPKITVRELLSQFPDFH